MVFKIYNKLRIAPKISILPALSILGILIIIGIDSFLFQKLEKMILLLRDSHTISFNLIRQTQLESKYIHSPNEALLNLIKIKEAELLERINIQKKDIVPSPFIAHLDDIISIYTRHIEIFQEISEVVRTISGLQRQLVDLFHESDLLIEKRISEISILITQLMIDGEKISDAKKELRFSLQQFTGLSARAMLNTNELLLYSDIEKYRTLEKEHEHIQLLIMRACKALSVGTDDPADQQAWRQIEQKHTHIGTLRIRVYENWIKREEMISSHNAIIDELQKTIQNLGSQVNTEFDLLISNHKRFSNVSAATILGFILLFSILLIRQITSPVKHLTTAVKKLKKGDLESFVMVSTRDEIGMLATSFNKMLSQRKKVEIELKESEERFRTMIEKSPLPMVITDSNQDIEFLNDKFIELFGYTLEDVSTAQKWWEIAYPDVTYRSRVQHAWSIAIEKAVRNKTDIEMQVWDLTIKDRTVRTCEFLMVPLGDVNLIILNDISDRKILEAQIQQSQKMEAIGTLAGGIAHDFNNILFPIVGYTEMMLEDVDVNHPFNESLKEVYNGAIRAKELVKQILTFSRQEKAEHKLMKIQTILKETIKLIRSSVPTTVEIKQNIKRDCPVINADPTQIHQIIMNLSTNAHHAMEDTGGILNIELNEVDMTDQDAIELKIEDGKYACLLISDTGSGIDEKNIERIFNPFFTTKEKGKGTGMGLSVVHGIVQKLNGAIDIKSIVGKGTQIRVYFPVVESGVEKDLIETSIPLIGGTERIFIVDDEIAILKLLRQVLERLGYKITTNSSSIEAFEAFKTNPMAYDLVITDMTMPGLTGDKLSEQILSIRPDIPIILCTGYSERLNIPKAFKTGIKGLLMKPIVNTDLTEKIREVLTN